jgi:hypothetical protein
MANLMRTAALPAYLLGTPLVESVHDYCRFAHVNGGRLAPMAADLVIA